MYSLLRYLIVLIIVLMYYHLPTINWIELFMNYSSSSHASKNLYTKVVFYLSCDNITEDTEWWVLLFQHRSKAWKREFRMTEAASILLKGWSFCLQVSLPWNIFKEPGNKQQQKRFVQCFAFQTFYKARPGEQRLQKI